MSSRLLEAASRRVCSHSAASDGRDVDACRQLQVHSRVPNLLLQLRRVASSSKRSDSRRLPAACRRVCSQSVADLVTKSRLQDSSSFACRHRFVCTVVRNCHRGIVQLPAHAVVRLPFHDVTVVLTVRLKPADSLGVDRFGERHRRIRGRRHSRLRHHRQSIASRLE